MRVLTGAGASGLPLEDTARAVQGPPHPGRVLTETR